MSNPAFNQTNTMQQETHNKSLIRDFYRRAVNQGDIAFAEQLIADDYIQHSKAVKPGKAGILEALTYMKQMPKPPSTTPPFVRLIAEGDFVVTNLSFNWSGKQRVVVDLFRIENGKAAEHWDAVQDQPETSLNGHAMMDGPLPIEDAHLTASNKKIAGEFFQQVFIDRQIEALPQFIVTALIQHKPEIANGIEGLQAFLSQDASVISFSAIHRIISEGDFVVIQSQGTITRQPTIFYDIFRLSDGQIVEQWGVSQAIH